MNTYTATLLTETGRLKHVHIMAPTAHEARRIITSWIGAQHKDAVALVNLAAPPRTPSHVQPSRAAHHALLCSMVMAAVLLILLHHLLTK